MRLLSSIVFVLVVVPSLSLAQQTRPRVLGQDCAPEGWSTLTQPEMVLTTLRQRATQIVVPTIDRIYSARVYVPPGRCQRTLVVPGEPAELPLLTVLQLDQKGEQFVVVVTDQILRRLQRDAGMAFVKYLEIAQMDSNPGVIQIQQIPVGVSIDKMDAIHMDEFVPHTKYLLSIAEHYPKLAQRLSSSTWQKK